MAAAVELPTPLALEQAVAMLDPLWLLLPLEVGLAAAEPLLEREALAEGLPMYEALPVCDGSTLLLSMEADAERLLCSDSVTGSLG